MRKRQATRFILIRPICWHPYRNLSMFSSTSNKMRPMKKIRLKSFRCLPFHFNGGFIAVKLVNWNCRRIHNEHWCPCMVSNNCSWNFSQFLLCKWHDSPVQDHNVKRFFLLPRSICISIPSRYGGKKRQKYNEMRYPLFSIDFLTLMKIRSRTNFNHICS